MAQTWINPFIQHEDKEIMIDLSNARQVLYKYDTIIYMKIYSKRKDKKKVL